MLTINYEDVKDLIYLVDVLEKRNKQCMNSLYGFQATEHISKARIRKMILELEEQQEENRILFHRAIDSLNNYKIDKYADRISVNMTVREYLQELLKEGEGNV